ncbi:MULTISPECIES: 6-phosphofructokinase [Capnocytophaga]|uniref:ATP-dependent 6-phosphofructokinase n=1 Tax=Capnocytophaga canis TaxID=1848903 RepID=A0A0B7IIZ2_9FLAO|nr:MULTISPECIES: 6-phosphofructokinase [Capnocytophaga]ATA71983.1 6-phosphofructokinase [Capnocytophaga sp. H4358]ATA74101.1 6-phosphofructokinase [Capnocytophaga sp. H2931]RIY37339.1 6-phosphofructokinase [Capnocytophaga canis]CEN45332.1 6-phosphofructokinase 2 [Capnocytophaga canis]CEN49370.1 6-phosphofructokinase 2 [Capnocytophaga canis]
MSVKKIAVLTSGGDAPGMNAAIRAVVRTCAYHNVEVLGVYRGYQGMIEGDFVELNARSVRDTINKGGTFLKSARSKEFRTPEGRKKAYENLKKSGADALIVIGGDGSFTGALLFNEEFNFPVMGIPGTIDNDIYGTSHTLGYDTALNTAVEAIDKIRDTASSHDRMFFIEVMGRDAGFIALNTGIGVGAERILIPEENTTAEELLADIEKGYAKGKTSNIIIVAEGDKSGKNVFQLKEYVESKHPGFDIRVAILGHMQRGGAPSCYDRVLASRMGVKAVETLLEGKSNYMVGVNNDVIDLTPLEKAIKGGSKLDMELVRVAEIMSV